MRCPRGSRKSQRREIACYRRKHAPMAYPDWRQEPDGKYIQESCRCSEQYQAYLEPYRQAKCSLSELGTHCTGSKNLSVRKLVSPGMGLPLSHLRTCLLRSQYVPEGQSDRTIVVGSVLQQNQDSRFECRSLKSLLQLDLLSIVLKLHLTAG